MGAGGWGRPSKREKERQGLRPWAWLSARHRVHTAREEVVAVAWAALGREVWEGDALLPQWQAEEGARDPGV